MSNFQKQTISKSCDFIVRMKYWLISRALL
jgi:hypothetical protein